MRFRLIIIIINTAGDASYFSQNNKSHAGVENSYLTTQK